MSRWTVIDENYSTQWIECLTANLSPDDYLLLLNLSTTETVNLRKKLSLFFKESNIFSLTKGDMLTLGLKGKKLILLILQRWFEMTNASEVSTWNHSEAEPNAFLSRLLEIETPKLAQSKDKPVRKKLAFISPLPPEQTGIANYNEKLLPVLGHYYDLTLVVQQASVAEHIGSLDGVCEILSAKQFREVAPQFDRLVYHIGNSLYHAWQFALLKEHPGLVVLHDYFLFDAIWWQDSSGMTPFAVRRSLYEQHGFTALLDAETTHTKRGPDHYPVNADIILESAGLVMHSNHAAQLHRYWYPHHPKNWVNTLPLYRDIPKALHTSQEAKAKLKIDPDTLIISSFGGINAKKATDQIVEAYLDCEFPKSIRTKLVLVGSENPGPFGTSLKKKIASHPNGKNITVTGYTNEGQYNTWMQATDVAIQLRKDSRGESSGTLFDVLCYQKCAVVNAHGSSAEVPSECVWQIDEEIKTPQLINALLTLSTQPERRAQISEAGHRWIVNTLDKQNVLLRYQRAIEQSIEHPIRKEYYWLNQLSNHIQNERFSTTETRELIKLIAPLNLLERRRQKRILFDISTLAWKDQNTGIERVTKELAKQLLSTHHDYHVELIQWRGETFYTHPDFAAKLLNISDEGLTSRPIEATAGDLYLSVEWSPPIIEQAKDEMLKMRARGVRLYFAVHDLLPILMPEFFPIGTDQAMQRWFKAVSEIADGLLCVSHTVAEDVRDQLQKNNKQNSPYISVFNSGADFTRKITQATTQEESLCESIENSSPTRLLMVGTLEPRKGHEQVLDGFENLWQENQDITLIIVGKQGWHVEHLINRLRTHHQLNKKLFWLEGCSDHVLNRVYQNSSGLIASSYGEGFGLPLVEAAQHGLPILARDIKIFREVAQNYADFFQAGSAAEMAHAITQFAEQTIKDNSNKPKMRYQSWQQSAQQLLKELCSDPALCLESDSST